MKAFRSRSSPEPCHVVAGLVPGRSCPPEAEARHEAGHDDFQNRLKRSARAPGAQSPSPGLGENSASLSGLPSNSLASGGGSRLTVMLGQTLAYSALSPSHFSRPGSVSGLMASTGHSGSHTPQSIHSSG